MRVQATQRFWSELPTGKHRLFQKDDVFETSLKFKDFPDGEVGPLMVPVDQKQADEYAAWRKANLESVMREHVMETMRDRLKAEAVAKVRAEMEAEARASLEAEMAAGGKRGAK